MSDYMVGKAATGGGVYGQENIYCGSHPRKSLRWKALFTWSQEDSADFRAQLFSEVKSHAGGKSTGNFVSPYQGETLDNGVLTVDHGITNSVRLTYENLREKVEIDLKTNWNNQFMR